MTKISKDSREILLHNIQEWCLCSVDMSNNDSRVLFDCNSKVLDLLEIPEGLSVCPLSAPVGLIPHKTFVQTVVAHLRALEILIEPGLKSPADPAVVAAEIQRHLNAFPEGSIWCPYLLAFYGQPGWYKDRWAVEYLTRYGVKQLPGLEPE